MVANKSSQSEKSQSSMQQEDKLKCVFLIGGKCSQGQHRFHGIDISRTTGLKRETKGSLSLKSLQVIIAS